MLNIGTNNWTYLASLAVCYVGLGFMISKLLGPILASVTMIMLKKFNAAATKYSTLVKFKPQKSPDVHTDEAV